MKLDKKGEQEEYTLPVYHRKQSIQLLIERVYDQNTLDIRTV